MIYLDHAATSFPKPPEVVAAVERWFRELGVSPGRGDSEATRTVAREVQAARAGIARLCSVPTDRVAFTSGATESLNLALRALLQPGDRVLTTAFEHSSVARVLHELRRRIGIEIEVLAPDARGSIDPGAVREALARVRPRLFVFTHASNVTGAILPAAELCALARHHGAHSLVDASQTAGLLPLAVDADLLVASCHKSLHAPPGLGFVAAREGLDLAPQKQGGTGSSIALEEHPSEWPLAFEAGTPNTPAILGLAAALRWIERETAPRLLARASEALEALAQRLAKNPHVRMLRPAGPALPILSFVRSDLDPAEAGMLLDGRGLHVRTGFHCAPWIHRHLGTEAAGTIRISTGPGLSAADVAQAAAALAD